MIFDHQTFDALRTIVFRLNADGTPAYPGYKPEVVEAPNGDGKLDREKRYAHVATKYLRGMAKAEFERDGGTLWSALDVCHAEATRVHRALGLPATWAPDIDASALRILEYPPGATSAKHTDFDLFTLIAYRDPYPGGLVIDRSTRSPGDREWGVSAQWPGIHYGELYELGGFGVATPHEVLPTTRGRGFLTEVAWQYSAVYFALPRHDLELPGVDGAPGETVGAWLAERYARSRVPR